MDSVELVRVLTVRMTVCVSQVQSVLVQHQVAFLVEGNGMAAREHQFLFATDAQQCRGNEIGVDQVGHMPFQAHQHGFVGAVAAACFGEAAAHVDVGFDDVAYCTVSSPALTTIHVNKRSMGWEAVRRLLTMMDDPNTGIFKIESCTEFVERDSVRSYEAEE